MEKTILKSIIEEEGSTGILVREAKNLGDQLAKPSDRKISALSTNQIRAIYGEVLRIKANWLESRDQGKKEKAKRALLLLRPKMAYRARKEGGGSVKTLVDVLDPAIELVNAKEENFRRFYDFFEAILAYHKAAGGK
jgi:CRISPR-associated protein Csm2